MIYDQNTKGITKTYNIECGNTCNYGNKFERGVSREKHDFLVITTKLI